MNQQSEYPASRDPADTPTREARGIVAGEANQKLGTARDSIQSSYRAAKETVADAQAAVVDKGTVAAKATSRYVNENPWIAVGAAATIGIAIGMLVRRR